MSSIERCSLGSSHSASIRAVVKAEIGHVPQQVALRVLRRARAHLHAQAPVGQGGVLQRIAIHVEAFQLHEAATVHDFLLNVLELVGQRAEVQVGLRQGGDAQASRARPQHFVVQHIVVAIVQLHDPFARTTHRFADPCAGVLIGKVGLTGHLVRSVEKKMVGA
ncbi:hypothetical protein [Ottowia sp.]|uniref:hypothetical protein n=1 Tax=Ottowia sp. TaxID=1898956 RepID=UPI0025D3019D|nr:hypothetical protein [Ottowia sp.]MBK6748400.1 hypothetical protein [Ottowia sp.]